MESVAAQTYRDFEHIIVDGRSTDGSVEIIREYADSEAIRLKGYKANKVSETSPNDLIFSSPNSLPTQVVRWISEKDNGIYDAQNKGITMAKGDYCYFLNAGDTFCADDVLERIFSPNNLLASSPHHLITAPDIIYGNEVIVDGACKAVGVARGVENPSFLDLYNSCMKHQASFIRRELFDRYGTYDDTMRMDADWDWFLRVIGFNDVTLEYRNVDIAYFEANGYSYTHPEVERQETEIILNRYMPSQLMQQDYELFSRYTYLKHADKQPLLRFCMRVVMKLAKILHKWQSK